MMNDSALPPSNARRVAWGWGIFCLTLVCILLIRWPTARLNSSVLALLPSQTMGTLPADLSHGFMQRLDRQVVWMISPGKQPDPAVAAYWQALLQHSVDFRAVQGQVDAVQQQAWGTFFWQHRNALIDRMTRERLQQGAGVQAQWVLSQLYSAFSGVSAKELQHDPLMLMRGAQMALAQSGQQLRLMDGWLITQDAQGNYWYLLHAELASGAFDMQKTHRMVTTLAALETRLKARYSQAQLLSRGTLFYSDYASQQAKRDVSTLGSASIVAVILLIVAVFRSLRPLLLCLLSIAIGALAGTAVTLLIYGELHMMTLVMSMSIIGISADYTLYYLTERMVYGGQVSPWQSLLKVRKALLLALITTVTAYLIMMFAPFPGIRQMALFASVGLSAACLTVIYWHPWLCRGLPVRPVPAASLLLRWLAAWRHNRWVNRGIPLFLTAFTLLGIGLLQINDDISQLQALPSAIVQQEKAITRLSGQSVDQKWFVVYGDTAQQTLERLEAFTPQLMQARQQGLISGFRTLPLNSLRRQQQDIALLQRAAPGVVAALQHVGVQSPQPDVSPMPLTVAAWLDSPISTGWRLLWLSLPNGSSGALVSVQGVHDSAALGALAQRYPGVVWVDRKQGFDTLFALYRGILSGLLGVALVIIAGGAVSRMGWREGLRSLIPSLLSLGCALAVLGFSGHPLNLFALLALVLVLGVGVNYTLFFSNPRATPVTSLLAITLAMVTTLLTLGMLVFSATQAISTFGIVLVSGIFTAFLLSPLAMPTKRRKVG